MRRLLEEASAHFHRAAGATMVFGGSWDAPKEVSADFLDDVVTFSATLRSDVDALGIWAQEHLVRIGVPDAPRGDAYGVFCTRRLLCPSPAVQRYRELNHSRAPTCPRPDDARGEAAAAEAEDVEDADAAMLADAPNTAAEGAEPSLTLRQVTQATLLSKRAVSGRSSHYVGSRACPLFRS